MGLEFLLCFLIATVITGGRAAGDIIHAVKGTTPPHLERARLKAQAAKPPGRSEYAADKPRLKDVAAVYWGDAMADAIASHDRRRQEKAAQRQENRDAAEGSRPARTVRPGWWDRAKRVGRLLWEPVGDPREATANTVVEDTEAGPSAPDPAAELCGNCRSRPQRAGSTVCAECAQATPGSRPTTTHPADHSDSPEGNPTMSSSSDHNLTEQARRARDARNATALDNLSDKHNQDRARAFGPDNTPHNGGNMSDSTGGATGDAHDVESAIHECNALDDDLTAINTALDVIDERIDAAGSAAEHIEAFLASKNVDNSAVGGMSVARDMLSPTHIKALIDAVAAAKHGVKAALDELVRLQELEQQLNGADGSVLNGR